MRTRVTPDPNHMKWINPDAVTDAERDIVVTVAEGGGMFVVNRDDRLFLWARPFPYDTPDINMNHIDVKTGVTQANWDKIFKQDGDSILGCFHNTRSLWNIAYHPGENALYVPFHDQCLSMTANLASPYGYGPRFGVLRPDIDPDTYMGIAKIDLSTGEGRSATRGPLRVATNSMPEPVRGHSAIYVFALP